MLAKVSPSKSACHCAWTATMEMIHEHKINKNTRFVPTFRFPCKSWYKFMVPAPYSRKSMNCCTRLHPLPKKKKKRLRTTFCWSLIDGTATSRNLCNDPPRPIPSEVYFYTFISVYFRCGGNPKIHFRHRRKYIYTSVTYKSNSWGFWLVWRFSGGGSNFNVHCSKVATTTTSTKLGQQTPMCSGKDCILRVVLNTFN